VLGRIDETANLLGGFRRVEKATSRRQIAVKRDQNLRDTFIHATDWYSLQRRILQDMTSAWSGVDRIIEQYGVDAATYMSENHALVRKYSLRLLVFILLTGGGQRPQVYCSLQFPCESILRGWEEDEKFEGGGRVRNEADREIQEQEESGDYGEGRTVKLYHTQEKTLRGTFIQASSSQARHAHFSLHMRA
jgi:hypothetical protein